MALNRETPPQRTRERASETPKSTTSEKVASPERLEGGTSRPLFSTREGGPLEAAPPSPTLKRVLAFTWLGVLGLVFYGVVVGLSLFTPGYIGLGDRIASVFLGLALLHIVVHGLGYANSMIKASVGYDEMRKRAFSPQSTPKVACVVTSFNEPPAVLEETVAALTYLDYPNKEIIILDDSTRDDVRLAVRDIATRYGVAVRQRTNRRGYKAGAINDFLPTTDAPFIAIFDADCLPAPGYLRDLVPIIEENPRLAFVQTPQYYANTDVSTVAMAASRQQSVFYEYICEGKDRSRAMFCCGTNFLIRRDALLSVGGFDEGNVTEDFATSLNLHSKGYDSAYYNQIYVYGLGPETLASYFMQQSRWAFGSIGQGKKVLPALFRGLKFGQWWEYFLSSTYYWIGWVNFIFVLLPLCYIFFGVQPLRSDVFTYLAVFIPYLLFTMNMFYSGLEARGYGLGDMIRGQQLGFITFPVHMSSAIAGLFGLKRPFKVTPKGEGGSMSWLHLWPQLLLMILSLVAFVLGVYRYVMGIDRNTAAVLVNAFWAFYNAFMLSGVFQLNRPVRDANKKPYFTPAANTPEGARAAGTVASVPRNPEAPSSNRGVFTQVDAGGKTVGRAPAFPQRRSSKIGPIYLALSLITLLVVVLVGWSMFGWYSQPETPRNVYVVDRTTGRDYQEHRALTWTLNYLKVKKTGQYLAGGAATGTPSTGGTQPYDYASDFFGQIPGNPTNAKPDPSHEGDLEVVVPDKPIPEASQLDPKGAIYLADTYGEFVEFDYKSQKYIHYKDDTSDNYDLAGIQEQPRHVGGLSPDDVDNLQDYANRGGLLIGEWNTLGYPTLPGKADFDDAQTYIQALPDAKKYLTKLLTDELPRNQRDLQRAQGLFKRYGRPITEYLNKAQANVIATQDRIKKQQAELAKIQSRIALSNAAAAQLAAQQRLEKLMHVDYQGWYGRYVDDFRLEKEYDVRLWKNVYYFGSTDFAGKQFKGAPKGAGFVFFKDGPSVLGTDPLDPNIKNEQNPFSQPIIITEADLADGQTTFLAGIKRTGTSSVLSAENGRLLRGVSEEVPCRFWFDVVVPQGGANTLAFYKLTVKPSTIQRLRSQGFPARLLGQDKDGNGVISMPAAIAYREGGRAGAPGNGPLRSFYFAGDASDYSLVSRFNEMFPSTGGISEALGRRVGPFSTQFYWNFYEPLLRNVLKDESGAGSPSATTSAAAPSGTARTS